MKQLINMIITIRSGRIWNNKYLTEDLEIKTYFDNPEEELKNTILDTLYLKQSEHFIMKEKTAYILAKNGVDFKHKRLSSLNNKNYIELLLFLHTLTDITDVIELSEDIDRDLINRAKNDGLLMYVKKDKKEYILLSDFLIKAYREIYLYEINCLIEEVLNEK